MELIVERSSRGIVRYWIWSVLAQMPWIGSGGTGMPTDDRYAPSVIAQTTSGERHVLLRTGTNRQAARAQDRFQKELDALGEPEFRRRYGLPEAPSPGA